MLEIKNLHVSFQTENSLLDAVRGISLNIEQGQTLAIVGESGAGKSQAFHAMMGLQAKNARVTGSARFNGQQLLGQPDKVLNRIRGHEISMVFQDPMTALNPYLTIGKQLVEVLEIHREADGKKARESVITALHEVKIPSPEQRFLQYPHELSGGMRQRIMIAMALLTRPKLIIADEPTTALDVTVQSDVVSLLRGINQSYNTSIVLITHDIPLVAGLCERVAVMYAGMFVEMGSIDEIHAQAQHPYTQALLRATPAQAEAGSKLYSIPGQPPRPGEKIAGCPFAARCTEADEACLQKEPELKPLAANHFVACIKRRVT